MSFHSNDGENGEQTNALLELIRALTLELHPHKDSSLHVTPNSSLDVDVGLDSLSRVELLLRIEQAFGITLPEHVMAGADTPADLLRAMKGAPASEPASAPGEARRVELEAVQDNPESAKTLVEMLEWHVEKHAERPHVTFYGELGAPEVLTYGQLLERSRAVAAGLMARGLLAGQTVGIMLPTGLEFFYSFMGALLAGGIPVPIYPPARASQIEDHLRRHAGIMDNARAVTLITVPEAIIPARLLKMRVLSMKEIVTPQELAKDSGTPPPVELLSHHIAHLQYTSGSTGDPKGVILTHDNLLANIRVSGQALAVDSTDVFVSWLPLYHDMGLIGAWLGSLYFSVPLHLMSPLTFLARPDRWLRMISDQRGTLSGGPNFAYELCLTRISDDQLDGIDLGSWRVTFNGAEPIIPGTMRRFTERFAPYGLRPDAFRPLYGLAEATVGLSFSPLSHPARIDRVEKTALDKNGRAEPAGEDDATALEFVSCGIPLAGHEVRIVNDADQELGEREEGRLQFKGPSATSGYYRNPKATEEIMHGDWIDSGDMAYIAEGEIYLTGRRKDIIIRAGRNIYPHQLEEAIGRLEGVRKGCVAVFGSTDSKTGTERLVALVETRETLPERLAEIRRDIDALAVELLETPLDDVRLAPPHTVPKTSSGKIRRAASREIYEGRAPYVKRRAVWLQVARLWLSGLAPQLRRSRRLAAGYLYGAYTLSVVGVLGMLVWPLVMLSPGERWAWRVTRFFCRGLLFLIRLPMGVGGLENLPREQPVILAVNHSSYLDPVLVVAVSKRPLRFVAKRELIGNFFARVFLHKLGTQFVERVDMQRGVEDARRLASADPEAPPLVFFPEGTFLRNPGLLPFHMGAFQAAAETGLPVVPMVLRGTRSTLRDGNWLPRRNRLHVHVSPPIAPEGKGWNAAVELRNRVRADMLRHVGEPDLASQQVLL